MPSANLISGSLRLLHCNFHTESSQAQFAVPSRSSFEANLPGGLVRFGPFIIIIKERNDTLKSNALTFPHDLGRKLDTESYFQDIEGCFGLISQALILLFQPPFPISPPDFEATSNGLVWFGQLRGSKQY